MNKFIGMVVLGMAFVIGFGSIAGCPKKDKDKDKDKDTTKTTTTVDKDKDKAKAADAGKAADADKGKAADADKGKAVDADKGKAADADKGKAVDADKNKKAESKLTVTQPAAVTLKQGAKETVTIKITRENLPDAAMVKVDKLPAGVSVVEKEIKFADKAETATFTLTAADDAAAVSAHKASVTVTSGTVTQTTDLPITVTKKG